MTQTYLNLNLEFYETLQEKAWCPVRTAFDRQCLLNLLLHCFLTLPNLMKAVGPILLRGSLVLFRLLFVCKIDSSRDYRVIFENT